MLIIIKNDEKNDLIINEKNIEYLNSTCSLKYIKNKNNILILYDVTLNEEGLIIEKNYFLDEVFISIPIETVITNNNTPIIKEMCQFYHCNLIVV